MENFEEIKKQVAAISDKMDTLMDAVVGNQQMGIPGFVSRLKDLEKTVDKIERLIERGRGYITGALFVGSAVGFVLSKIIDNLKS